MCELGDFYIFHELLVAGGTEKGIFFATSLLCNFLRDTASQWWLCEKKTQLIFLFSKTIDSFLEIRCKKNSAQRVPMTQKNLEANQAQ